MGPNPTVPGVTGLVLAMNSRRTLAGTLASLDFCEKLLVVDSGSTDGSVEMARAAGARVEHRDWDDIGSQFRHALSLVDTPWVVSLDSDEALEAGLKARLAAFLREPGDADGFELNRLSWYLDRFVRHSGWYPDWNLRAFRTAAVRVGGTPPHHSFQVDGPVVRLPSGKDGGHILHWPYADLSAHLERIDRYTSEAAQRMAARGRTTSVPEAVARGAARFVKMYLVRGGVLDGRAGLTLALLGGYYAFLKYAKLYEKGLDSGKGEKA